MARAGRPTKYRTEFAKQAAKLCALGATDAQLADFFDVNVATIHRWKHQHAAFCNAIKVPKDAADGVVERSLYQRAVGYEYDETDIRVIDKKVVKTQMRKHYPPEPVAAIFWLKNRQPERWRDIKAVELTGKGGGPVVVQATSEDEGL